MESTQRKTTEMGKMGEGPLQISSYKMVKGNNTENHLHCFLTGNWYIHVVFIHL